MSVCQRLSIVLLGSAIMVLTGCTPPPGVMKFNNMMARGNAKLAEKAKAFYNTIAPLSKAEPVPAAKARAAADEVGRALAELRQEFATTMPPTGSRNGPDLLARYREFLDTQQRIYDNVILASVRIIEDNAKFPEPFLKWNAIQPLLARATQDEGPALDAVRRVHTEYCKAHNLEAK